VGNGMQTVAAHGEQRVAGVEEGGGGGVRGSGCARQGNRGKRIECSLLVLLGDRGKEEEQALARNAATVRWRPGSARVGVARAEEASGGDARAVLGRGMTRGSDGSRRCRRGGAGAAVSGADCRRQKSRGQSRGGARGGRRGKEVRGTSLEIAKT
jgi:hypothetical protein